MIPSHSEDEAMRLGMGLPNNRRYRVAFLLAESLGYHLVKDTEDPQDVHGRRVEARQKDNPYASGN